MGTPPDFVVVGHITLDTANGSALLGGAAYSALAASRLGRRVGLFTSYGPDLKPGPDLDEVQVMARSTPRSTVFRNSYRAGRREQRVLSASLPLNQAEIPPTWRQAAIVHLAPMVGEVGPEFLEAFPGALMGASTQGWVRRIGPEGVVEPSPWAWSDQALSRLDAVIFSLEDVAGDEALILRWAAQARCLVLTEGKRGAWVYCHGEKRHIKAFRVAKVVDPTGAGDVFASAFLVKWAEGMDPFQAAAFAGVAASFVVEHQGLAGVPTLAQLEEWWRRPKHDR